MTPRSVRTIALASALALVGAAAPERCRKLALLYELTPESTFVEGCFAPLQCPTLIADIEGSFKLRRVPFDPAYPFKVFEVLGVDWVVTLGPQKVSITGSGTYELGGEFALIHRLELDLEIHDGRGSVQHFDSGFVVGGSEFPEIAIRISIHGERGFDTVIDVRATPIELTELL